MYLINRDGERFIAMLSLHTGCMYILFVGLLPVNQILANDHRPRAHSAQRVSVGDTAQVLPFLNYKPWHYAFKRGVDWQGQSSGLQYLC